MLNMLKKAVEQGIDAVLPPRCVISGEAVERQGMIAAKSWTALNFIVPPYCVCCGSPFAYEDHDDPKTMKCLDCLNHPPSYDAVRSALYYDDASKKLVLGFKHGDQTHAVKAFIPWMLRAGQDLLSQTDSIVPVPLHRWRMLRRRYNQSALIAKSLGIQAGLPVLLDGLERVRPTVSQGKMNADLRRKNVVQAFKVGAEHMEKFRGKNILIVDDVFTSGATAAECAKTLKSAGAQSVFVLTLARAGRKEF